MAMKRYALVDAAVHPDAAASYRQATGGVECCALLPPGVLSAGTPLSSSTRRPGLTIGAAERGGWLMRLDHPRSAQGWLQRLQARDAAGITELSSARTFDVVLMHLQLQLRLDSNEGGPGLLRFHDPRVVAHLHHFITPGRMEELFAPFCQWRTCDRDHLRAPALA